MFIFRPTTNPLHRLANLLCELMSPPLFCQLLICAVGLAIFFVAIDLNNIFAFKTIIAEGITFLLVPGFLFCLQSEMFSSKLLSIGDSFYDSCEWYAKPVKYQKLILQSIQVSQREIRSTGFGIIDCSLEVFASVRNY